ncbi:hypothetical protein [Roseixanthobacter glucoisosaccharinicivorans]|uniref:hypothetical protein n=1 Tax=Roseixanthobacter glucoisosaccharinicivorans TaxID=3119923 RepID=UPI00372AD255
MTAASEITDAREALTYQWEESRRALLATAKASQLPTEQYNAVLSAIHLMHAVFQEDIADMLEAAASRPEADEPGENPRREHGTYFTANGMRAA